ncbi:hypothetical protein R3P38DRAFT_3345123, partial [Favolaschia claudopus]
MWGLHVREESYCLLCIHVIEHPCLPPTMADMQYVAYVLRNKRRRLPMRGVHREEVTYNPGPPEVIEIHTASSIVTKRSKWEEWHKAPPPVVMDAKPKKPAKTNKTQIKLKQTEAANIQAMSDDDDASNKPSGSKLNGKEPAADAKNGTLPSRKRGRSQVLLRDEEDDDDSDEEASPSKKVKTGIHSEDRKRSVDIFSDDLR